jgi:hypothetical protein
MKLAELVITLVIAICNDAALLKAKAVGVRKRE